MANNRFLVACWRTSLAVKQAFLLDLTDNHTHLTKGAQNTNNQKKSVIRINDVVLLQICPGINGFVWCWCQTVWSEMYVYNLPCTIYACDEYIWSIRPYVGGDATYGACVSAKCFVEPSICNDMLNAHSKTSNIYVCFIEPHANGTIFSYRYMLLNYIAPLDACHISISLYELIDFV